jgi:hypothetical protein
MEGGKKEGDTSQEGGNNEKLRVCFHELLKNTKAVTLK